MARQFKHGLSKELQEERRKAYAKARLHTAYRKYLKAGGQLTLEQWEKLPIKK